MSPLKRCPPDLEYVLKSAMSERSPCATKIYHEFAEWLLKHGVDISDIGHDRENEMPTRFEDFRPQR